MKINKRYIYYTFALFCIELCIALFIKDTIIRPFIGDVLVVMLIYYFLRIFYHKRRIRLAIGVLFFSFLIEFSQYVKLIEIIQLEENKLASVVLGATFDWLDLWAYTIGVIVSYFLDNILLKKFNSQPIQQ